MKNKIGKRIYTTKISSLICRPLRKCKYKHEFLNKMTNKETNVYFNEIKKQLDKDNDLSKIEYDDYKEYLLREREEIYQSFKIIGEESTILKSKHLIEYDIINRELIDIVCEDCKKILSLDKWIKSKINKKEIIL